MIDPSVSPRDWGARIDYDSWSDSPVKKDKIIIHYNGPAVSNWTSGVGAEKSFLQAVERFHIDSRGWRGIAYGWAIGASGTAYRLRGWNNYGAHAGDLDHDGISENKEAIPVFFLLGEGQAPTPEMLARFRNLYQYFLADPRSASWLNVYGHRDVSSTACPGDLVYNLIQEKFWEVKVGTAVQGAAQATYEQAKQFVESRRTADTKYGPPLIEEIVRAYWSIAPEYGVRADLALAQALKETGYFRYGGAVHQSQFNFAGIGATGGVPGITFPSVSAGVRAHLLRMHMYAVNDAAAYNEGILGRPLPSTHWGKYPNIEDFNGVWAVPGTTYGQSIVEDYLAPMLATVVAPPPTPQPLTVEQRLDALEARMTAVEGRL